MKKPKIGESHFFVDESGDPTFYNSRGKCIVGQFGCSTILILGFVETQNPAPMRRAILDLQEQVMSDAYLIRIAKVRTSTAIAFHAKNDPPEVRHQFFRLIETLDFKAQFIVARKLEHVFKQRYQGQQNRFYDDLVTRLFENVLHRFGHNEIIFSARGSAQRRKPLEQAIWRARGRFEKKYNIDKDCTTFSIRPQTPKGEPCLSVSDYMNWAVYRAFLGDGRYYEYVKSKISFLRPRYLPDLSDGPYSRKNPFDTKKAAPLRLGS